MLSVDPDAIAQPAVVGEEKGLSGDSSIAPLNSAEGEMYEEKEETPVDVIKDKAKGDFNPVILIAELQQKVNLKASSNGVFKWRTKLEVTIYRDLCYEEKVTTHVVLVRRKMHRKTQRRDPLPGWLWKQLGMKPDHGVFDPV
ncbi:hypothetical protein TNIN_191751 [Trichonephila inaurata madagascariensis]|uniref:Uncharacterized protein n=1 Tax=Trichonephila inaurata madagascariensis TaxID=2747483 RepID=A0A8X6MKB1_9ARAC|nr:hypothetical protein TNIN_191751 [Trichonephila inaurata madagascariensis]